MTGSLPDCQPFPVQRAHPRELATQTLDGDDACSWNTKARPATRWTDFGKATVRQECPFQRATSGSDLPARCTTPTAQASLAERATVP